MSWWQEQPDRWAVWSLTQIRRLQTGHENKGFYQVYEAPALENYGRWFHPHDNAKRFLQEQFITHSGLQKKQYFHKYKSISIRQMLQVKTKCADSFVDKKSIWQG